MFEEFTDAANRRCGVGVRAHDHLLDRKPHRVDLREVAHRRVRDHQVIGDANFQGCRPKPECMQALVVDVGEPILPLIGKTFVLEEHEEFVKMALK